MAHILLLFVVDVLRYLSQYCSQASYEYNFQVKLDTLRNIHIVINYHRNMLVFFLHLKIRHHSSKKAFLYPIQFVYTFIP